MKLARVLVLGFLILGLLSWNGSAQQPAPTAQAEPKETGAGSVATLKPGIDKISQNREALRKAEAEHPGNTAEVAEALDDLVSAELDAAQVDAETLAEVNRELRVAEAASGTRSKQFIGALGVEAEVLVALGRAAEARPVAGRMMDIAQKEFPDSDEASTAADDLGFVCSALGDFPCGLHAFETAIAITRKMSGNDSPDLVSPLNNLGALKYRMGDLEGSLAANEEALAIEYRVSPNDEHICVVENNVGAHYIRVQKFDKALEHLNRALALVEKVYGTDSPLNMEIHHNLGDLYSRMGHFSDAWRAYEFSLTNKFEPMDMRAGTHAKFALSLAQGGNPAKAIEEGLLSARTSREMFVLQARTLPERQALAYDAIRPLGLDPSISVLLKHPELSTADVYQEVVRSRALVADEMARRQRNLNADNNPETARLLNELDHARAELLAAENSQLNKISRADMVNAASGRMEAIERSLAERSAAQRYDERIDQVTPEDVRQNLPPQSVLVSYVLYKQNSVDALDSANTTTPSYVAFVLHPDSNQIRIFNLGDAASLDELVRKTRAAADAEAQSGGLGSIRNERVYRETALTLRQRVWDPLKKEIAGARLVLLVADGNLNLVPFASLPDGPGYLVEHGPVIHTLSSERDLLPAAQTAKKQGLLAIGSPTFVLAGNKIPPSPVLRGVTPPARNSTRSSFSPCRVQLPKSPTLGPPGGDGMRLNPRNL